jgi:hypothetical protein
MDTNKQKWKLKNWFNEKANSQTKSMRLKNQKKCRGNQTDHNTHKRGNQSAEENHMKITTNNLATQKLKNIE